MAKTKPCKNCGHGRSRHMHQNNGEVTRCKYRYAARNGSNLHVGPDTDNRGFWKRDSEGRSPKHYQCMCPKWEPEEVWKLNKETDEYEFVGYNV